MPTHQQFLDAISVAPDDRAVRLIYADWLEEQGNPLCGECRKPMLRIDIGTDVPSGGVDGFGDGRGVGIGCGIGYGNGKGSGAGYGSCDGTGDGLANNDGFNPSLGDGSGDGVFVRSEYDCMNGYGWNDGDGGEIIIKW